MITIFFNLLSFISSFIAIATPNQKHPSPGIIYLLTNIDLINRETTVPNRVTKITIEIAYNS